MLEPKSHGETEKINKNSFCSFLSFANYSGIHFFCTKLLSVDKLFVLLLICISCTSKPQQHSEDIGIQYVKFGSGGGFTGRYKSYDLNLQSNVLAKANGDTIQVNPDQVEAVRDKLDSIDFFQYSINHPYNITYFIEVASKTDTNRIIWGEPGYELPKEIKDFHNLLVELTKE